MIYIFNNISIFMYSFILKHIKTFDRKEKFLFLSFLQMSLIIGFRYAVGADFFSYIKIFEYLKNDKKVEIEIGFKLINILCIRFGIPYWGVNLIIAILTNLFLVLSITNFNVMALTAIYFYISFFFFYHSMNQIRQGIAMTIGLYAISKLCKGENIKFFLLIILASLFHMSALIYFVLYFLKDYEINLKIYFIYFMGTLVTLVGYNIFVSIIAFSKYGIYFNSYYDKQFTITSIVNLCVRFIILLFVLYYSKKIKNGLTKNILYHMAFLCTFFQVLTIYSSVFGRVTSLFFIGYVILFPLIISGIGKKNKIKELCYIGATLYQFVYYHIMKTSVLVNDYQSIFSCKN